MNTTGLEAKRNSSFDFVRCQVVRTPSPYCPCPPFRSVVRRHHTANRFGVTEAAEPLSLHIYAQLIWINTAQNGWAIYCVLTVAPVPPSPPAKTARHEEAPALASAGAFL